MAPLSPCLADLIQAGALNTLMGPGPGIPRPGQQDEWGPAPCPSRPESLPVSGELSYGPCHPSKAHSELTVFNVFSSCVCPTHCCLG